MSPTTCSIRFVRQVAALHWLCSALHARTQDDSNGAACKLQVPEDGDANGEAMNE